MSATFRRLPNGVLYRCVSAYDAYKEREAEEIRAYKKSPEYKADRAEERKAEKRLENIGFANDDRYYTELSRNATKEAETVSKLVKAEIDYLSRFDIADIYRKTVKIDGKKVAALTVRVIYEVTEDDDLGLEVGANDAVYFTVYRNPENPAKLEIRDYNF